MKDQLTTEQMSQIREKYKEKYGNECDCSDLRILKVLDDTCETTYGVYATRRFRNRIVHCIAEVLGTWEF
mgnify:FL=1